MNYVKRLKIGGGGEEVPRLWPMEIGKVETKESTA